MYISRLRFFQYRNLSGSIELSPGVNVFFGRNGQGKTNILEAVYLVCYGRSFRQGKLADLPRFDADEASIELDVVDNETSTPVLLSLTPRGKALQVGGRENVGVEEVAQQLRVILFGPDDMQLVKGSKNQRRDFLDEAIWAHYPPFSRVLRSYQRLLKERNQLLRDLGTNRPPPLELVESYECELARYGGIILDYRMRYLREFVPLACDFVKRHTDAHLELAVDMESSILDASGISAGSAVNEAGGRDCNEAKDVLGHDHDNAAVLSSAMLDSLRATRAQDIATGWTSVGPHMDDLALSLNGRAARFFASQGEQRQVAVGLKLAQLALWRMKNGVSPVLLLDDVASELDEVRSKVLLSTIDGYRIQTLLTTTSRLDVLLTGRHSAFEVCAGAVTAVAPAQVEP